MLSTNLIVFSFIILLSILAELNNNNIGVECINYKRKKIVRQGDLMIGALLPVHEQPTYIENQTSSRRICGVIRDQYGIQRVEALLYMLDKINDKNKTNLLPGIKLGLEIRDECWDSSIALEETIDFIKDTIAIENNLDENGQLINFNSSHNNSIVVVKPNGDIASNNEMDLYEQCQAISKEKKEKNKILAVIGPAGSTVTINVQNLLQLFDIPQIGYSATTRDLSDKKMFKTFLRVVPSDYLQVWAMVDLVVKMNWTYLFAIYTEGSYGQTGMEAFRNETSFMDICLAMYEKIREYASDEDYDKIIKKMNATSSARVIVCFCYGETIRGLLGAINRTGLIGRFLIVGSDGWSDRIDVAKDYYEQALGSFSIKAYSPKVTEFDNYFINLNPSNNERNIWFNEYWEDRFNCYIEESSKIKSKTKSCKRKCPDNFVEIGNSCYYFSEQKLNGADAQAECKNKYFNSDLIDLNNNDELVDVLEYIALDPTKADYFLGMHTRIKFSADSSETSNDGWLKSSTDEAYSGEEILKFKLCKKNQNRKRQNIFGNEEYAYFAKNESFGDFEATLSDDDVITVFSSHTPKFQCISILVTNDLNNEKRKNNFTYCGINNCLRKLPFVCKFYSDVLDNQNRTTQLDFYPDTLRNYEQDPKMSYVINSMLAIVYGLNNIQKKFCGNQSGLCEKMKNLNGSELLKSIKASQFKGITDESIYFNANGDPPGRYVILNVQKVDSNISHENSTRYFYREVGNWNDREGLTLHLNLIKFPNDTKKYTSICSEECKFGYIKQIQGGVTCCWNCKKCEDYAYISNPYTCKDCDYGHWPNKTLTGCEEIPLTYLKWNEPASLVSIFVSGLGILINTFITYIFMKFSNTCIVKSTTKELSYIILTGIYLCYFMTIPLILKPTKITCYLYRILPGFSLSLIYGALIVKTNRIARILARSKKRILTKKPRFMSLTAQIIITLEPGELIVDNRTKRNESRLMCQNKTLSVLGPIGYNMALVLFCTWYAIRTRNLPENFNEAKFIGFSMYTTCVIWLAFIALFFGSDFKVITLCLSTSFSATVILIFLFLPKVYIIIFEPEKNQRSAFATAKEIRCHFGSTVQSNSIDDRSKMSNGMSLLDKLGLKPELKSSLKAGGSLRSKSAHTRFAYRPRSTYGGQNDKSMDSFETYTSMYQISDRSCQTSLELLEPFVDRAIKRKKLTQTASVSYSDDDREFMTTDRKSSKMAEMLELDQGAQGPNALGALGNLLLLPLIASHNQMTQGSENVIKNELLAGNVNNEDKREENKLVDENNNPINPKRLGKRLSQGSILMDPLNKVFNKAKSFRASMRVSRAMRNASNSADQETSTDLSPTQSNQSEKFTSAKIVRTPLKFTKNKNTLNQIVENSSSFDSNDVSRKKSAESIKLKSEIFSPPPEDEVTTDSVSSLNKNVQTNLNPKVENITKNVVNSDCDSEFTIKMELEDKSLEDFKRVINQNKNLVLNWDYVQSSDYL